MKEIERKFLLSAVPENLPKGTKIEQSYLSFEPEKRIRRSGEHFFYTEKNGGGLVRDEREREIGCEEYMRLKEMTVGNVIYKTRYVLRDQKLKYEIDIYEGSLEGLRVVEVEFESVMEAEQFKAPVWFGEEITGIEKFKNRSLALI